MNSSSTHAGPPFSPHDAAAGNGVVFKKQVLKLGLDGSSLPRLVVVTEKNVYVCLPSGGITRTIAVACIERITLSPREDMVSGDASDATDVAPPSSPNKAKKEPSRSPGSFFATVFSRGRGGAKDSEKKSASRSRHRYEEDVDETHPASPKSAAPPTQQPGPSAALSSSDQQSSTGVSPAEWAVIATLGIASEAPLALQLLRVEDGVDFVAALRASPHISASAVFNVPDEDGPTNAMGELLFAPPARRADPIVPRVLERDADEKEGVTQKKPGSDVAENTAVDEVELSPSSPRSTNVASPPPMTVSADVEVPSLRVRNAGRVAVRDAVNGKNNNYNAEEIAEKLRSGGARGQEAGALHTREHASSHSSPPSSRSPPPSSKASSVHTAEEVVTLTPVHAPTRPSPDATPQMQQQQQSQKAKEPPAAAAAPTHTSNAAPTNDKAPSEGRTPSPLRAAPLREPPQPPPPLVSSTVEASDTAPRTHLSASQDTSASRRRTPPMEDEAAMPPVEEKQTPTIWETIRDSEARHTPSPLATSPAQERHAEGDRVLLMDKYAEDLYNPPARLPSLSSYNDRPTDTSAAPVSSRLLPRAGSNTAHNTAASSSPSATVRTPVHVEGLQGEPAGPSETVARLRRSLEAQEALLRELADVKNDVRSLRAALAERGAQCAEWQAAYTHAQEHIDGLRREQAHLLEEQEERLRRAHRAELEAVQTAFDEYDTRMTDFVDHLQRDHRKEAAQWQHERRTLHHQLEELRDQQEEHERRASAVAEDAMKEARRRQPQSPPPPSLSPTSASYLDHSLAYSSSLPAPPTGSAGAHENASERVKAKVDAYMAQRQRQRQAATPPAPAPSSPVPSPSPRSRGNVRSPPTSSWPRVAFGSHCLFDTLKDEEGEEMHNRAHSTAALQMRRRDSRGDSFIQTPPTSSCEKTGDDGGVRRDAAGYVPHRRTFV